MSRLFVRCKCGHQVLAKEVLRTDLYERPSGRNYVYVKFRCKRCKRMGESFVAEHRWDWSMFEPIRNEMSDRERDQFAGRAPVSVTEILDFHRQLQTLDRIEESLPAVETPGPVERSSHSDSVGGVRPRESKGDGSPLNGNRRPRSEDAARNTNAKNGKEEPPSETPPPAA